MSPDNDEEDQPMSGIGEAGRAAHPHVVTKHRRGKTGRARKKRKHWGYFSRWGTDDGDDDDDIELYQWSKSRGLTSRSLPPSATQVPKPTVAQNRSTRHEPAESRSAIVQRTQRSNSDGMKRITSASDISLMQEVVFMTKLCASIEDKKTFVDQSLGTEKKAVPVPEKQTSPLVSKKQITHLNHARSAAPIRKTKDQENSTEKSKRSPSLPCIVKSATNCEHESAKTQESLENKDRDATHRNVKNPSSRKGSATSSSTSILLPKKEWSANVESDILRLYQTSASVPTSSLVCSWAAPSSTTTSESNISTTTTDVTQVIEKKIEKAEHTPSYVQALAKMFRSRMQMRKEREQRIENDLKNVRQKKDMDSAETGVSTPGTIEDTSRHCSTTTTTQPTLVSPAHLRYRHLSDDLPAVSIDRGVGGGYHKIHPVRVESFGHSLVTGQRSNVKYRNYMAIPPHGIHFHSRAVSPSLDEIYDSDELENDSNQEGERIINSLAERLENEAKSRSEDVPHFKLNVRSELSKLQRPTPPLSSGYDSVLDSNSVQVLARKARQCLLSNSRLKYAEKNRKIASIRTPAIDISTRVATDAGRQKEEVQVRWPASVGSLYFRPPARILSRESAPKA